MTCLSPSKVTVGAGWSRPIRFDKAPFFKIKVACSFVSVKIIFIIKSLSAAFSPFIWIASKSNSISGLRFWDIRARFELALPLPAMPSVSSIAPVR